MDTLYTLQSLVQWLRTLGDKECVLEMSWAGITRWTCAQVADTARQLAGGLAAAGVQPGEPVPVLATNRPEWVVAALAVLGAGAVVSPLDTQITTGTLERVLRDSEARYIFTTTDYLNRLRQLNLNTELRPILFDVEPDDERGWQALLSEDSTPLPVVEPDDPAALFYTSGTTGVPKGVPLTHRNLVFQLQAVQAADLLRDDDRILLPLPMYHVYPFTVGMLTSLAFGLPLVLPQSLTGPQVIRAIREGEVTIIIGVPRVYRAMYNGIEGQIASRGKLAAALFRGGLKASIELRRRFGWQVGKPLFQPLRVVAGPKLRLLISGGSALDPDLAWKLAGMGWDVGIGYGLTETSPMLTMNLPGPVAPRLASVGRPLPGIDLRIDPTVQAEEEIVQTNGTGPTEGEIQARGVSVFSGYRNLPNLTTEAFTEDGWFHTGDLGYVDQEGYLYVSGRVSTLIVLEGGKKIQPDPLEEVYQENQFIREIGILYQDNQLVALIVPEIETINRFRNRDVEQAIREAVSERTQTLPSYQRITDYAITETPLARTNLGKLRRHELVKHYNQARQGVVRIESRDVGPLALEDMSEKDQALLDHLATRRVWEWLAGRYPDKLLTPDTSPQLDLGVDSLEWLTLTLHVSAQTGVELSDQAIGRISTVRDLLQEVLAASESEVITPAAVEDPEALLTAEQKKWLSPPHPALRAVGVIVLPLFRGLARVLFQVKVCGLEHLPRQGNVVLTPNHSSMLDGPLLAAALPYTFMRQTHWAAAADIMLTNPLMRLTSRIGQVLPIERFGAGTGVQNLALAMAVLQRQKNLVWFPEGRISPTDKMLPFREGIGIVLDQQPVLVVPVFIQGTRAAMPLQATFPKLRPVTIIVGQPYHPRDLARQAEGETAPTRIVRALQDRVAALADQAGDLS